MGTKIFQLVVEHQDFFSSRLSLWVIWIALIVLVNLLIIISHTRYIREMNRLQKKLDDVCRLRRIDMRKKFDRC